MFKRLFWCLGLVLALAACGGGSDGCASGLGGVIGSSALCGDKGNKAPVANAGPAQKVSVGAVVLLDGTYSRDPEGGSLRYSWSWVSKPANSATVLASGDSVKAAFVADVPGTYVLGLVVNDGKADSPVATVSIEASQANSVPVASAGVHQSVVLGQTVTLDGSASTDADRHPLSFAWRVVSRPAGSVAALSGETGARPVFTPDVVGLYALGLVVGDGEASSEMAVVTVAVAAANAAPVADAGLAQNVVVGAVVRLDASASSDANRDPLSYSWSLVSKPAGSAASLSAADAVRPTFTADAPGTYVFSLSVSDGVLRSDFAAVSVVASSVNAIPVALTGPDQRVLMGTLVTLDGSGSTDADRDPLSYEWMLVSKPEGSTATLSSVIAERPTFTADLAGTYVFSLTVSDGVSRSDFEVVSVVATATNAAPVAQAGPDQTVRVGGVVTLDGSGSTDANRDTLLYDWTLVSKPAGSAANLSSITVQRPTFTADVIGTYVFSLMVSDGLADSRSDVVVITVLPLNGQPVAGATMTTLDPIAVGTRVDFSATSSRDPEGQPLQYQWLLTTVPTGSTASLSGPTTSTPSMTPDLAGVYVLTLVVNDGLESSLPATLVVSVVP